MWMNILWVGIGSMAGGISRYLLSSGIRQWLPGIFPWGTLLINLSGCFLIGILAGLFNSTSYFSENHKLLLTIGFCGSFTTFSTFSLDSLLLLSSKAYLLTGLNITISVAGGLLATFIGYHLARP